MFSVRITVGAPNFPQSSLEATCVRHKTIDCCKQTLLLREGDMLTLNLRPYAVQLVFYAMVSTHWT